MQNLYLFLHLVGLIIGLGAVTVIDLLGFLGRKSKKWTYVTIQAHKVTKPLIWLGTILLATGFLLLFFLENFILYSETKIILLIVMIFNGAFLSFHVSPRLLKIQDKKILLPNKLQNKILVSMVFSIICWWTFVILTVLSLSI